MAPIIPPIPTTEPTAALGKVSEGSVNRFADQPWCAAAANPTRPTTTHRWLENGAQTTGTTANEQISKAILRAKFGVLPRRKKIAESQPPPILPTIDTT